MTDNINLASVFRLTAVNFRLAGETLFATMELKNDGSPAKLTAIPFYYLASHAAELLLKSALLKRGLDESDLRRRFGHDLRRLLEAVQQKGVSITPETVSLIDGLHKQHHSHSLRYDALLDDGQPTFMPPPRLIFIMLDELLMLTRLSN
jgi:hypothetical protein